MCGSVFDDPVPNLNPNLLTKKKKRGLVTFEQFLGFELANQSTTLFTFCVAHVATQLPTVMNYITKKKTLKCRPRNSLQKKRSTHFCLLFFTGHCTKCCAEVTKILYVHCNVSQKCITQCSKKHVSLVILYQTTKFTCNSTKMQGHLWTVVDKLPKLI